jgi:hypothetical protein
VSVDRLDGQFDVRPVTQQRRDQTSDPLRAADETERFGHAAVAIAHGDRISSQNGPQRGGVTVPARFRELAYCLVMWTGPGGIR